MKHSLNHLKKFNSCDYFDMNLDKYYLEFDKPLYSIVAKRKTANILYMKPKQYIFKIAYQFGISYDDALIPVNNEVVDKYSKCMLNGDKFPVGYFTKDNNLQEGRHRILAAMKLGCDEVPVIEKINLSNDQFLRLVYKFEPLSYEELDDLFIGMGFSNGITQLGYNDLRRYIQYNL